MDATPLPAISSDSQGIIVSAENNTISVLYTGGGTGGGGGNGYWQIDNGHSYLAAKHEVESLKKELESLKTMVTRLTNNKIASNKSVEEPLRKLEVGN